MSTKENLDLVIGYTKQFIDSVTPIAKQAYEIGLLTLRIDAANSILLCLAGLVGVVLVLRFLWADYAAAKVKANLSGSRSMNSVEDHLICMGIFHVLGGIGVCIIGIVAVVSLLNVWLWTKLIAPELWLAHQAVEKLIK